MCLPKHFKLGNLCESTISWTHLLLMSGETHTPNQGCHMVSWVGHWNHFQLHCCSQSWSRPMIQGMLAYMVGKWAAVQEPDYPLILFLLPGGPSAQCQLRTGPRWSRYRGCQNHLEALWTTREEKSDNWWHKVLFVSSAGATWSQVRNHTQQKQDLHLAIWASISGEVGKHSEEKKKMRWERTPGRVKAPLEECQPPTNGREGFSDN